MAEIDYHIEISTLVEFINEQIKSSTLIPISGAEIFKHIRRAVLDAEIKPFLYSSEKEDKKNYYQKYVRLKSEFDERYVPDFFESEGDFYELDKRLNNFIDNTNNYTTKNPHNSRCKGFCKIKTCCRGRVRTFTR